MLAYNAASPLSHHDWLETAGEFPGQSWRMIRSTNPNAGSFAALSGNLWKTPHPEDWDGVYVTEIQVTAGATKLQVKTLHESATVHLNFPGHQFNCALELQSLATPLMEVEWCVAAVARRVTSRSQVLLVLPGGFDPGSLRFPPPWRSGQPPAGK